MPFIHSLIESSQNAKTENKNKIHRVLTICSIVVISQENTKTIKIWPMPFKQLEQSKGIKICPQIK